MVPRLAALTIVSNIRIQSFSKDIIWGPRADCVFANDNFPRTWIAWIANEITSGRHWKVKFHNLIESLRAVRWTTVPDPDGPFG